MVRSLACGAAVYRRSRGKVLFLLIKHANGGHWGLPKGHTEPGETEVETALREIEEETGLSVKLKPGFRHTIRYNPTPGVDKTVVFFVGKARTKQLKLQKSEVLNGVWLELADAQRLLDHSDVADVLSKAQTFLDT